jgi:hypothetical protein
MSSPTTRIGNIPYLSRGVLVQSRANNLKFTLVEYPLMFMFFISIFGMSTTSTLVNTNN